MLTVLLLICAGAVAGAINAVAGGGAILLFPILLFLGVLPVEATATIFLAVLPGFFGALTGYRQELAQVPKFFLALIVWVLIGAAIGAILLTRVDPDLFADFIPWLVLSAVTLLAFQARIHHIIVTDKHLVKTDKRVGYFALLLVMLLLSVYGGFFGVGIGIMMMAVIGLSSKIKNTQQLSALKVWYVTGIDIVAISIFLSTGLIHLQYGGIMAIGSLAGGYAGARYSRNVSSHTVHNVTVLLGALIAAYLFLK